MRICNLFWAVLTPVLLAPLPLQAQTIPPDSEFHAKLLAPLSTETNRKGDKITAQVVSPQEFNGDIIEGEVRESKSGGKVKGRSVLNFTFQTLNHAGAQVPIQSQVKSVANSKGVQNADEEGRVVEKKNNLGKTALATGIGALIGAAAGGAKGAAIGAGVGAAASLVFIQMAVKGANVTFAPGSEFVLLVKERRSSGAEQ
jgi:hypothetical protein